MIQIKPPPDERWLEALLIDHNEGHPCQLDEKFFFGCQFCKEEEKETNE